MPSTAETRPSRAFAVVVLLAGLTLNVGAALAIRSHASIGLLDADEQEYWGLAGTLLHDGLAAFPARRTLPFPLLLASFRAAFGDSYPAVQLALSALLALVPFATYHLVRRQVGAERVAQIAALLVLFWPPFVRFNATLYSDSIALLAFLCFLNAFSRAIEQLPRGVATGPSWVIAGVLLGLCIETKPLYLLYVPFAVALSIARPATLSPRRHAALLLAVGCGLSLLPWSLYISTRERQPILVSGNDAETLAGGLNPALLTSHWAYVTGDGRATWVGPGKWLDATQTGYLAPAELSLPYQERRVLLRDRSLAWIRSHPGDVAYLTMRKVLYMWGIYPFWNGLSQTLLGNCLVLALIAAACVALVRSRRRMADLAMFWTLPLFSTLVACISWGSWRFRMPGDVGLIVLAAAMALPMDARRRDPAKPAQPPARETPPTLPP
jgi:4-amino-4-deoxy-L-arabinose transferase-like glycosyltransferase